MIQWNKRRCSCYRRRRRLVANMTSSSVIIHNLVVVLLATPAVLWYSSSSSPNVFWTDSNAYSSNSSPKPPRSRKPPLTFQEFRFAPNGVCLFPQYFVEYSPPPQQQWHQEDSGTDNNIDEESKKNRNSKSNIAQQPIKAKKFTMRNVPGDGDCMFLAVALAAATSTGLGANDALLRAISRETRSIVAQVLSSEGNLYISPGNSVEASKLLRSAVRQEPSTDTEEEYLQALRKEGREGGLYGGGPELAVLANVLRRPISIYEIDKPRLKQMYYSTSDDEDDAEGTNDVTGNDDDKDDNSNDCAFPIVCKGSFGEGIFDDPCLTSILNSAVLSNVQPGAFNWRLHILVLNVSPGEKHACVLLPQPGDAESTDNDRRYHHSSLAG